MPDSHDVAGHYTSGRLLDRLRAGVEALGLEPPVPLDSLAPADEFHIGGRLATVPFLERLGISDGQRVLDMGCGLGGPARFAAQSTGAHVTGIDLTAEFVEAAEALTELAGLEGRVAFRQGSILDLPFEAEQFDAAYMIHVGMNIADKAGLAAEAARILKPGGVFGVYDVMCVGDPAITFPVPWAADPVQSALATPEEYRAALYGAGFEIETETDQTGFAKDFFANLARQQTGANGPPPLGLHLVMGENTALMVRNMVENITAGRIAPTEMIARKGG